MKTVREEEYSWIFHAFYGTFFVAGYSNHEWLYYNHPELHTLPRAEEEIPYDPPRGCVRVDRTQKRLYYTRYDQSQYAMAGSTERVYADALDEGFRQRFKIPSAFGGVLVGTHHLWERTGSFELRDFSHSRN